MADNPADRPPRRDPDANPDNAPHNKDNDHPLPNLDFLKKLPGDTSPAKRMQDSDSGRESDPPAHPSGSPESNSLSTTPPGGGSAGGPSPHNGGGHRPGSSDGGRASGSDADGLDSASVGVGAGHADGSVAGPPVGPAGQSGTDGPRAPAGQPGGSGRGTEKADQAGGAEQTTIGSTARDATTDKRHPDAGLHVWASGRRPADPPLPSAAGRSGSALAGDGSPAAAAAPTPRQDARPDRAGAGSVDASALGGAGAVATTTPEQRVPTDAVPPAGASAADTSHLLLAFDLPAESASFQPGGPAGDAAPTATEATPSGEAKDGRSSARADTATGPHEMQPAQRSVGRSQPVPSMPAPQSVANQRSIDPGQLGGDPADQRSMSEHLDGATPAIHEADENRAIRRTAQKVLDVTSPNERLVTMDRTTESLLRSIASGTLEHGRTAIDIGTATMLDRMVDCARERRASGAGDVDINLISTVRPHDKGGPHRTGSAIDVARYAGKQIHYHNGADAIAGTVQFYMDMLGVARKEDGGYTRTRPPVNVHIALGLTRNPKMDVDGATREYYGKNQPEKKKEAYDLLGRNDRVNHASRMVPVLRCEEVRDDFFLPRAMKVNVSPTGRADTDIDKLMPAARAQFKDLYDRFDNGVVLRYLMPDAWDHLHSQVVYPGPGAPGGSRHTAQLPFLIPVTADVQAANTAAAGTEVYDAVRPRRDGERLPAAANAWHGIGIEDVVREHLPHTDGTPSGHDVRAPDGSYVLKPQVLHTAEGDRVAYYNAWNPHGHRVEFAVGPGDVDTFLNGCNVKLNVPFSDRTVNAWQMNAGSYFGVTGANTEWQRQSAKVVDSMMRGDWADATRHFARSYAEAAKDPGWWLTVADAALAPGAAGRTGAGREAGGLAGAGREASTHPPAPAAKPTPAAEARPDPARSPVPGGAPTPAKGDGAGAKYEPPRPGSGGERPRPGSSGQSGDHSVSSSDRTWAAHDNPRSQWNNSPHLAGDRRGAPPTPRPDRTGPGRAEGPPGPLAGAGDAEIDKAVEGMTSPRTTGRSRARIDDHAVPTSKRDRVDLQDVPRLTGETQRDALTRVRQVVGRDVSTYGEVRAAWNRARDHVTSTEPLARENYVELYDHTRERFWQEVRADPAARERFEKAGFRFSDTNQRSAPMLDTTRTGPSPTERRLSLDHKAEKAIGENWRLALDPDNLRFELQMPNTYREIVQMRHPELRESADDPPTR